MRSQRLFGAACAMVLLSGIVESVASPAQASTSAVGCVNSIGICDSHFCATTSFGNGIWWFAFVGGRDENSFWDAYYYAGDGYVLRGEVSPSGC